MKTTLNIAAWIVTILFQIVISLIAGYIFFAEGYGNIIFMGLGITLSVFLIGWLGTILRQTFSPKKYFIRLGLTSLGVYLPLAIFYHTDLFFYNADYETPPEFPFLAALLGIISFYAFGWLTNRSFLIKIARITGYSTSAMVIIIGAYSFWKWLTPIRLPIQNISPSQSLNTELVNVVGNGGSAANSFNLSDLEGSIYIQGTKGVLPTDESTLYLMDFSDPTTPVLTNAYNVGDYYYVIAMYKDYVYIHVNDDVQVLDISNPVEPVVVWQYDIDAQHARISVIGNHAYLVDEDKGTYVYDISDSAKPILINHQPDLTGFSYGDFDATGKYLLVLREDATFVFDISNPARVVETSTINKSLHERITIIGQLAFLDDSLYVGNEPATLSIADLSNPAKVKFVSSYHWLQWSNVSGTSEEMVYISDWSDGLHIVDFSDPKKPIEIGFYGLENGAKGATSGKDNLVYVLGENDSALYVLRFTPPILSRE